MRHRNLALAVVAVVIVVAVGATIVFHAGRLRAELIRADPDAILTRPDLAKAAIDRGRSGFAKNCASCHADGRPDRDRGIPDLTDRDFLYGSGRVDELEQIVLHGIRSGDPRGYQLASMPAYGRPKPYAAEPLPPLSPQGVRDVVQFLLTAGARKADPASAARGAQLYTTAGCYDCHGRDAGGDEAIGAPSLIDDIWLYGDGSPGAIQRSVAGGRAGFSPAFGRSLSAVDARAIAVYVASLAQNRSKDSSGGNRIPAR